MPRTKLSEAERVLGFFQTTPLATAQVMLDLVKSTVRARGGAQPKPTPRRPRVNATSVQEAQNA